MTDVRQLLEEKRKGSQHRPPPPGAPGGKTGQLVGLMWVRHTPVSPSHSPLVSLQTYGSGWGNDGTPPTDNAPPPPSPPETRPPPESQSETCTADWARPSRRRKGSSPSRPMTKRQVRVSNVCISIHIFIIVLMDLSTTQLNVLISIPATRSLFTFKSK